MSTVRSVVVDPSAPAHLALGAVDTPVAGPGDALVRVHALSLNRGEVRRAQSEPAGNRPGWDIAGVVEQAAADGSGPKAGERVVGLLRTGAWAQLVAVPALNLAVLPASVSFSDASTLPVAGLTALYALDRAPGLLGRNVLVTGASGGVGHLAVQLAKHGGASVTGLVRQEKHAAVVRDAGADAVVADESGEAARAHGPYNLVLESVSGQVLASATTMMAPSGLIVVYGVSDGRPAQWETTTILRSRITISSLFVFTEAVIEGAGVGLTRLARMVADGRLKPNVAIEAPWSEIGPVAQQLLDRSYPGKAVLLVS